MKESVREAIFREAEREPFCRRMGIRLVDLDGGYSLVEMRHVPEDMDNLYQRAHGGAIFALIDEAFETSCQTDGTICVAMNVNVTYVASPDPSALLRAESKEVARTKKTATFDIKVTQEDGRLIAVCQALAYRTGKSIPWL